MQNLINTFRSVTSCCLVLFSVLLLGLGGCENPGSIDVGGSDADIRIDSLTIEGLSTQEVNNYSGQFSFISAGQFQDPLFGNLTARGLIKPTLTRSENDTITSDSKMLMRVILDGSQAYGDSLADQSFDIYEVNELWRGNAIKLKDSVELADEPLTSFTVGDEDSIDVELPSEWVDEYRQYRDTTNADSLYRREFFGLALVPSNSNKIIAPNMSDTRFVIQNPEADTFDVSTGQWAYMLDRDNSGNLPQNSMAWHSTHEQVLNIDIDISEVEIAGSDIAKAELVLYQNNELMEGSLPASEDRPEETRAQLYLINPNQLLENITPGNPIANGLYSSDDEAFHFNFTSQLQNALLNGLPEEREYFVTLVNNGIIKSSVIYNLQAPEEKKPKLIITSLTNNSN